jgi:acetyl esterase/lipase
MSTVREGQASCGKVIVKSIEAKGAEGPLQARLYRLRPAKTPSPGLIVFFHQGGFIGGSLDECDEFARALVARSGMAVLAAAYTLACRQPFPAAVEDAYSVLQWAARCPEKLGWSGDILLTAGIEAGGNLAAVAALMARDRGGPDLAGQILIMPMLDPGLTSDSMRALKRNPDIAGVADACAAGYRGYLPRVADRMHPYASPLQSSRLKGLPSALILSAQEDPLCDEAEQYGARLAAAGTRATVCRLPPLPLNDGMARCRCAREQSALEEIAAFIGALQASGIQSNNHRKE